MILKINNSRENDRIFPIQIHLKQPVMHSSLLKRENSFRIIEQNNSRLPLTTPSPPLPSSPPIDIHPLQKHFPEMLPGNETELSARTIHSTVQKLASRVSTWNTFAPVTQFRIHPRNPGWMY